MDAIIKILVLFIICVLLCLEGENVKRSVAARKIIGLAFLLAILLGIAVWHTWRKQAAAERNKSKQDKQSIVYTRTPLKLVAKVAINNINNDIGIN